MRFVIYPYKMGSKSSKILRDSLGAIRAYPDGNYRPRRDDIVINWGNTEQPQWLGQGYRLFLNKPQQVLNASDKVRTLTVLRDAGLPTIPFTTDRQEAMRDFDRPIVRTLSRGSRGRGLIIPSEAQNWPSARLYTNLVPNHGEYRLHVVRGEIIAYTKKRRRRDYPPQSEHEDIIRTHENGWIFTRGNLRRLERIETLALNTVEALGLDFCAVDIIKDDNRRVHVLEVNSAAGITGSTVEDYTRAFRQYAT